MDVIDFTEALCQLNTAIQKYLNVKKAREYCTGANLPLPNDITFTIQDILDEKISQYEKQIVELATKLANKPEDKPDKKKK